MLRVVHRGLAGGGLGARGVITGSPTAWGWVSEHYATRRQLSIKAVSNDSKFGAMCIAALLHTSKPFRL